MAKSDILRIRIRPELKQRLFDEANRLGVSASELLRVTVAHRLAGDRLDAKQPTTQASERQDTYWL